MKYLKKYSLLKESTILNSLTDEELEEKAQHLRIELNEINAELILIDSIQKERENERIKEHAKDLPDSIFKLNKEQLDFIFEGHKGMSKEKYDISRKYFSQLVGVHPNSIMTCGEFGFNEVTNQFNFKIDIIECFELDPALGIYTTPLDLEPGVPDSIKFLGENLKKTDGYVEFKIQYEYIMEEYVDRLLYVNDVGVIFKDRYVKRMFHSIKDCLEAIHKKDMSNEFT